MDQNFRVVTYIDHQVTVEAGHKVICICKSSNAISFENAVKQANFIAKACNAYAVLTKALRKIADRPYSLNDAESSIIRRIAREAIVATQGE